jgi:hypothetical protein
MLFEFWWHLVNPTQQTWSRNYPVIVEMISIHRKDEWKDADNRWDREDGKECGQQIYVVVSESNIPYMIFFFNFEFQGLSREGPRTGSLHEPIRRIMEQIAFL